MSDMITIDDFFKVELRVGKVMEATHPEVSEKLIRLRVDFSDGDMRTIFTGVRPFGYTADDFLGKQFLFVTNLQPRKMPTFVDDPSHEASDSPGTTAGKIREESQGMILAVDGNEGKPIFVTADGMPVGAKVR